jgi:hypothetical protein
MNEQAWAVGSSVEIYCSAPLQDKFAVLAAVEYFLVSSNCPYGLSHFLNMPTIRDFGEFTSTSSYKICSGPKAVCNQVVMELVRPTMTLVVERTIARRIPTSRYDDENGRCNRSSQQVLPNVFFQFILQSTTISTSNVI